MLKKILAAYVSSFLIFHPVAFADEKVATLTKGEKAPFTGTIFNTEATARLLADLELSTQSCQIETNRLVGINRAEMQLEIDGIQASLDASRQRYDEVFLIKNNQIDFLDQQLSKSAKPNNELWFMFGIIGGVVITGAAAWSINQVSSAN